MRIKADLRSLIEGQPITSLSTETPQGSLSFTVASSSEYWVNEFILIGNLDSETTELLQIASISGNVITPTSATQYDHSQDTYVTAIGYNQVQFFYSPTVGGTLSALSTPIAITPESYYTYYDDTANTTGYGYFQFYNSVTGLFSILSNPVPYTDFNPNSVKAMLDRFYTQIGNREKKLIKDKDVIDWMNEAYAIVTNRLNLSNRAYNVPTPYSINVQPTVQEYALPTGFSKVRTLNDSCGNVVLFISLDDMPNYVNAYVPPGGMLQTKYYLRNQMIGLTPIPTTNIPYFLYYQTTSTTLASYIDYMDVPNNNFYCILDYLLYRACPITGGNSANFLQAFNNGLNNLVITSHKQDGDAEKWDQQWSAVV